MTVPTETSARVATGSTTWISWLRAIAIVGVIVIHSVGFDAAVEDARSTVHGTIALWMRTGAICAVPLFVMLSGAVLLDPRRYTDHATFLRKRAVRLIPALAFWHLWYWALISYQAGTVLPWRDVVVRTVNGNLYTALYFFWIIIGLALFTPILIGFIRDSSRRAILLAGFTLAAIPAISVATMRTRGAPVAMLESAWTWWFGYLGLFILGWGLRGVRLPKVPLAVVALATVALGALGCWQWRNPEPPLWLQTLSPVGYYGAGTIAYAIGVFLVAQALIQPDGALAFLTRGRAARIGTLLGSATLGVFGFHLTIIWLLPRLGVGGDEYTTAGLTPMFVRLALTIVISFAVVLVLRRVPYVRAVL